MDNSYGFKIPKDEVAHLFQLAAIANIAEAALVAAREHEGNIEESKIKTSNHFPNFDQSTFKSHSGSHGGLLNHVENYF